MATRIFNPLVKTIPTRIGVCIEKSEYEKIQRAEVEPSGWYDWPFDQNHRAQACTVDFRGLVIVCLPLDAKTSSIVHESVHVFEAVMRDIGEKAPSEEFRAYGIQAIFEAITAEYLRLKKVLDVSPKTVI